MGLVKVFVLETEYTFDLSSLPQNYENILGISERVNSESKTSIYKLRALSCGTIPE